MENNEILADFLKMIREDRISAVSLFVNNDCNLKCKHCYVGYKSNKSDYLTVKEWVNVLEEAISKLGAIHISIAGKEPLLSFDKTEEIFDYLSAKIKTVDNFRFGLVTNGILINERVKRCFKRTKPSFIDVSIDGTENIHDIIRGGGTFKKAVEGAKKLLENGVNVIISHTLNSLNVDFFYDFYRAMEKEGLKKINISPYFYPAHCVKDLSVESDNYANIVKETILKWNNKDDIQLIFRFDHTHLPIIKRLIKDNIINLNLMKKDKCGNVYVQLGPVFISFVPFPIEVWNTIRISAEGFVSGCREMSSANYNDLAIGHVKEQKLSDIIRRAKMNIYEAVKNQSKGGVLL